MPDRRRVQIQNFDRGLNTSKNPALLLPGEFSALRNFFIKGGQLRMRPGAVAWLFTTNGLGSGNIGAVTGLQMLYQGGVSSLIALRKTGVSKASFGGSSTNHTDAMTLAFASDDRAWRSTQYNQYGYAVRPDLSYILRFDDASYWSLGIAAPTTAAVLATGAAGSIEAGAYYGVFTFVDADGVESDYSPVSNQHTPGAGNSINWSSVDVSTNPRVVARNLYRTLPDQSGEYFYVGTIADNTTTTYNNEDTTVPEMGDLAPVGHTPPPAVSYIDIETWVERLWATDGEKVYASLPEDPDSFDPEYTFAFRPDDGQEIKAIKRVGDSLVVLKSGSIHALSQSLGAFEFLPRVVDEMVGCVSTKSVAVGDGRVFFRGTKAVFMTDGRNPAVDISTGRIEEFNQASIEGGESVGVYWARMGWYIISESKPGTGRTWAYDYRQNVWYRLSWDKHLRVDVVLSAPRSVGIEPMFVATSYVDSDGFGGVYAVAESNSGGVWDVFPVNASAGSDGYGDTAGALGIMSPNDLVSPITASEIIQEVKWQGQHFGSPGSLHHFRGVRLATDNPAEAAGGADAGRTVINLDLYSDSVLVKSRDDLVVVGTHVWKSFGLNAEGQKATLSEVLLKRVSRYELIIKGVEFEADVWDQKPRELT